MLSALKLSKEVYKALSLKILPVRFRKCTFPLTAIRHCHTESVLRPPWSILFFGNDNFSIESLKILHKEMQKKHLINNLSVVISSKKDSVVKQYAQEHNLFIYGWPPKLKKNAYHIGVVASFGHLIPENIISSFPLGMLNVHASLLPRWRGAAPIIYAIMNGDIETGITIMQIKPHKFDVGGIVKQSKYSISRYATLPTVSAALARLGSALLLRCIKELPDCLNDIQEQPTKDITYAPRVYASLAKIEWDKMTTIQVFNLYRALDGVFPLFTNWQGMPVKLFHASLLEFSPSLAPEQDDFELTYPGFVYYHKPTRLLKVKCSDERWIFFKSIGMPGKKLMSPSDFYNGYLSKVEESKQYFG